MKLRVSLLAVALAATALAPVPALARDKSLGDAVEKLNDPKLQGALAQALETMSTALLDLKVGGMMRSMEEAAGKMGGKDSGRTSDIDPEATVRDLAGPGASGMPKELAGKVPQMMGAMAGMGGALEQMLPQLEDMARQMKRSLPQH